MNFSQTIIDWYQQNKRDLPWRKTDDPYKIWLSEIILQQTRVEQGRAYYEKFIITFPTVTDLAKADEEQVLNLWQGLGYYSRARNLHFSARYIVNELRGKFPTNYTDLLKLKGVGSYTAAAIASFSYNEVVPVVDGNVYRVLSRCFEISHPIDTGQGQKYFFNLAKDLISKTNPAVFNQAIMEFGALHCTPKNPKCDTCVLDEICLAKAKKLQEIFPIKKGKVKVKPVFLYYFVFMDQGKVIVRKRGGNSIWANLYDFPSIEADTEIAVTDIIDQNEWLNKAIKGRQIKEIISYKHLLSHRRIYATFYWIKAAPKPVKEIGNIRQISVGDFEKIPVSKLVDKFWHHFSKEQAVGKRL